MATRALGPEVAGRLAAGSPGARATSLHDYRIFETEQFRKDLRSTMTGNVSSR